MTIDAMLDKMPPTQFSGGQDNWYNPEFIAKRQDLIEEAKGGKISAKNALMMAPFNLRVLVIDKQIII